jgi:hypothetical protein
MDTDRNVQLLGQREVFVIRLFAELQSAILRANFGKDSEFALRKQPSELLWRADGK